MHADWITHTLRFAALVAAMIISFAVQRDLALSHGVPEHVAPAVPLAIDIGMLWAVRVGRDVALAVAVSVLANTAGTLTHEPLDDVSTWVSAALHSVFPLLVWRMERTPVGERVDAAPAPVVTPGIATIEPERVTTPVAAPVSAPVATVDTAPEFVTAPVATADTADTADVEQEQKPERVAAPRGPRGRTLADIKAVVAALQNEDIQVTGETYAQRVGNISSRTGRRDLARIGMAG